MNARAIALIVAALALAVFGCQRERRAPPAAPLQLESGARAIPADLDLVLRVDVRKIRAALGDQAWRTLGEGATRGAQAQGDAETERFLAYALARADVAYLGVRPAQASDSLDNVLVLVGDLRGSKLRAGSGRPPWQPAIDLGADVRRYDRAPPELRSAPARIYLYGDEKLVCVSEAEIDAVERVLERRQVDPALEPPEQGVISLAARVPAIRARLLSIAPAFAELLDGARRLEGSADVTATGVRASLAVEFDDDARAQRFAEAGAVLAERLGRGSGTAATIARAVSVTAVGRDAVVRLALDRSAFGEIVTCAAGSRCL